MESNGRPILTDIEKRILDWTCRQQAKGLRVTEHRLYMAFDNGTVWGRGYEGVVYFADRLVKKGLLIKKGDTYQNAGGTR